MTTPTRLYDVSGGTTNSGTTTATTTTTTTETRVTLQYDTTQGNVDVQGGLVGTAGREVTLTAYPRDGYVFSYWETFAAAPSEDITFGVFSGQGTINGTSRPFVQSVPFGTAIAVECIPAAGYQFDSAETFDVSGNSLGLIIYPSFTVYANGQLDEVRVYFTSITTTTNEPVTTTSTSTTTGGTPTGGGTTQVEYSTGGTASPTDTKQAFI